MRWVGHVSYIEDRGAYRILVERCEGNSPLGRLVIDGMMIIWIFKKLGSHGLD